MADHHAAKTRVNVSKAVLSEGSIGRVEKMTDRHLDEFQGEGELGGSLGSDCILNHAMAEFAFLY